MKEDIYIYSSKTFFNNNKYNNNNNNKIVINYKMESVFATFTLLNNKEKVVCFIILIVRKMNIIMILLPVIM